MPWKTIGSIFILILIILFISFNLGEGFTTNVSLVFTTFENIPVFLVVLISFTLGVLVTLPIAIFARKNKKCKNSLETANQTTVSTEKNKKTIKNKIDTKAPPVYMEEDALSKDASKQQVEATKKTNDSKKSETVNNSEKKVEI